MPERLKKCITEWRDKGVHISDEEAEMIYKFCLRKMEVAKIPRPDKYIDLLYPDEVKNYLIRQSINATTLLRELGMEVQGNVC